MRISRLPEHFEKGYGPSFSHEIFSIQSILHSSNQIPTFILEDSDGHLIRGSFYENELVHTFPDSPDTIYLIEKIFKSKKLKGKLMHYVKWKDFSKKSWIEDSEILPASAIALVEPPVRTDF